MSRRIRVASQTRWSSSSFQRVRHIGNRHRSSDRCRQGNSNLRKSSNEVAVQECSVAKLFRMKWKITGLSRPLPFSYFSPLLFPSRRIFPLPFANFKRHAPLSSFLKPPGIEWKRTTSRETTDSRFFVKGVFSCEVRVFFNFIREFFCKEIITPFAVKSISTTF